MTNHTIISSRADAQRADVDDALAAFRDRFILPAGVIYLDGNSLGPLPAATPQRIAAVLYEEWGELLIRGWTAANWVTLPQRAGGQIAGLIGADSTELVCADSTSVNLFKVLVSRAHAAARPAHDSVHAGQFSNRSVYGAGFDRTARRRLHTKARAVRSDRQRLRRRCGRRHAHARELQDRADLRHAWHHADRACAWRADDLGSGALGRRAAGRSAQRKRRLRHWLRLQVFERRPGRAGLFVRGCAPSRRAPTAVWLAWPRAAVFVQPGVSNRRPASTDF